MKIIQPIDINPESMAAGFFLVEPDDEPLVVLPGEDFLVYPLHTNVPEEDLPAWDEMATYAEDDVVIHEHVIWTLVVAESTGDEPGHPDDPNLIKWGRPLATNPWRMFDDKVGTYTSNPESIEFYITPNSPVDAIGFFGIDASSVEVTVFDATSGVVAFRETAPVLTDGITDWYAYFFNPIELRRDFVLMRLPPNTYYSLKVSIKKPGGVAKAGAVVLGRVLEIGRALQGSSVGIVDYSRKERDTFGNWQILERAFSKKAEFDIVCNTRETGTIQRELAKVRAKPTVWIGHENLEATLVYGFYKDFNIVLGGVTISEASITVEGLTE